MTGRQPAVADQIAAALQRHQAFGSGRRWRLDVITDPVAHPPISMYDGTLDEQAASGPSQHPVS